MSKPGPSKLLIASIAFFLWTGITNAQPRSVGVELSPFDIGATYRHAIPNSDLDAFHSVKGGVDIFGNLVHSSPFAGFFVSYSYDIEVLKVARPEGVFCMYLGPGINIGMAEDLETPMGFHFGPMMDFGAEYNFKRMPISLEIGFQPTVAMNVTQNDNGHYNMGLYKHGLYSALTPHLGITYRFGHDNLMDSYPYEGEKAEKEKQTLLTYGVEIDYTAQFHVYSHFNYISESGYRVNHVDTDFSYLTNAQILGHIGMNLGKHTNLAVYGGYMGVTRHQKMFPLCLRATVLFGQPEDKGRGLMFASGGVGFKGSSQIIGIAQLAKLGGGYRFGLTRNVKLDVLCSLQEVLWHPNFFAESLDIRRSNEICLGLNLGTALVF